MIKLSKPSKMKINGKQVKTFDLEARKTCPGSKVNGDIVPVCKGCYAHKGFYRMSPAVKLRQYNLANISNPSWVSEMVKQIGTDKYFRFFSSGDIYSKELALKIEQVIKLCPQTNFWIPTRSYRSASILLVLERIKNLPNASVKYSADHIGFDSEEYKDVSSYVINNTVEDLFKAKQLGIHVCPVNPNTNQKSCNTCTMCYTSAKVAYVLH